MFEFKKIPIDAWYPIFEAVDDRISLADSSRACRAFWEAATPSLYREIIFRHIELDGGVKLGFPNVFAALSAHPHLRAYVRSIRHVVSVSYGQPTLEPSRDWVDGLASLPNAAFYTIHTPPGNGVPDELLTNIIDALRNCPSIHALRCDFNVHSNHLSPLAQLPALRSLTLGNATHHTVRTLRNLLRKLPNLQSLLLEVPAGLDLGLAKELNATSVLRVLTQLHIGRGHQLSPLALLTLLTGAPRLTTLSMFYDNFIGVESELESLDAFVFPGLPELRELTVTHQGVARQAQFRELFAWLRELASGGQGLVHLAIISDDGKICTFQAGTMFIALAGRHTGLRTLAARHIVLNPRDFSSLVQLCKGLEHASFAVQKIMLSTVLKLAHSLPAALPTLTTLDLRVRLDNAPNHHGMVARLWHA